MRVRVGPLTRWDRASETFFDAVQSLGLGPGWRLHVVEDPAAFVHVFHLSNDLADANFQMKLSREELAEDTKGCQTRILDWIQECVAPPFDVREPALLSGEPPFDVAEPVCKTRQIDLDE